MKKIQVDKNGCKYILFRIDVYFNKFLLAVEIDEKGHTDRNLIFEEKRQKALGCKFIRINTSNAKNGYEKIKELEKKINRRKRNEKKLEKEMREMRNSKKN